MPQATRLHALLVVLAVELRSNLHRDASLLYVALVTSGGNKGEARGTKGSGRRGWRDDGRECPLWRPFL